MLLKVQLAVDREDEQNWKAGQVQEPSLYSYRHERWLNTFGGVRIESYIQNLFTEK